MNSKSVFLSSIMNIKIKQQWGLLFLLFVTAAYIIIFFILNRKPADDVIEIYFADRITAAHKVLIEKYNRINKGKVKVIGIDFPNFDFPTNERKEMLARSLRGRGEGIDLFAVDIVWVQRFAKWCEPLNKYFTEHEKERIVKSALESCYYDGELTSTLIFPILPIFSISPSWITRRSLTCAESGSSATSSRKSVPRLATSNSPGLFVFAL